MPKVVTCTPVQICARLQRYVHSCTVTHTNTYVRTDVHTPRYTLIIANCAKRNFLQLDRLSNVCCTLYVWWCTHSCLILCGVHAGPFMEICSWGVKRRIWWRSDLVKKRFGEVAGVVKRRVWRRSRLVKGGCLWQHELCNYANFMYHGDVLRVQRWRGKNMYLRTARCITKNFTSVEITFLEERTLLK